MRHVWGGVRMGRVRGWSWLFGGDPVMDPARGEKRVCNAARRFVVALSEPPIRLCV
jgi:hypothetical protein